VKAHDTLRAALTQAAAQLGAPGTDIVLERPKKKKDSGDK